MVHTNHCSLPCKILAAASQNSANAAQEPLVVHLAHGHQCAEHVAALGAYRQAAAV